MPSVSDADMLAKGSAALDQWRGLALVLVLISHGLFFTGRVFGAGRIGVNLFFFISGILTYRSLAQMTAINKGTLVRSFWWRRLRRLYPALTVYVITMLIAIVFLQRLPNLPGRHDFGSYVRYTAFALTYSMDYVDGCPIALSHLWSLAVEMQFYILAPLMFILGGKNVSRRLLLFAVGALSATLIGLAYPLLDPHYERFKYHFEVAAWPMMAGFACECAKRWFYCIKRSLVTASFWLGVLALIVAMITMPLGLEMKRFVIATGGLLLFPCLFGYLFGLRFPGKVGYCLEWLGKRTYSIYLWQQPLTLCGFLPTILHPAGAVLSVVLGECSFRTFEKPFLSSGRSRQRMTTEQSGSGLSDERETLGKVLPSA